MSFSQLARASRFQNTTCCDLEKKTIMWRLLLFQTLAVLLLVKHSTNALTATIRTDPESPPYPAATWILFACDIENAAIGSTVHYNWTVYCSQISPPQLVGQLTDMIDVGELSLRVRSTPGYCADMVVCTANDTTGNTVSVMQHIPRETTGVGFWGPAEPIFNNRAYLADESGEIGTIRCHSSSFDSNVGRWIGPSGADITSNHIDSFVIQFSNGPYTPSYSSLGLFNPLSDPFVAEDEGVYSCIAPDENGDMQTVNVGLYTSTHSNVLSLTDAHRISESPLTLNCATSGLPASVVQWRRAGDTLSAGSSYEMTRVITDRRASSYDNMLTINLAVDVISGFYECLILSVIHDSPSQTSITNSNVVRNTFAVLIVGSSERRLTCSLSDSVSYVTWENEDDVVVMEGNVLMLSANDSVHERTYSCRGYANSSRTTIERELNIKPIIIVPDSALSVSVSSADGAPVLGQQYSITCQAAKTVGGLINIPNAELILSNGTEASSINGITLTESLVGETAREVLMSVSTLHTSHAGSYICRGSLNSPAKSSVIVADSTFNITVQLPSPVTVTLSSSNTSPTLLPGRSVSLHCHVTISTLINTPVDILVTWTKSNGDILTSNDRITIRSQVEPLDAVTYQSTLRIDRLNRTLDSNANIMCSARVISSSNADHLLPSDTVTSQGHLVNVVGIFISTHAIGSPSLQSGNGTYTLVCTVTEEQDISGVPIVNWIGLGGQTLESTSSDDITMTTEVFDLTKVVQLHFNPLRASHGGEYTCRAVLATVGFDETRTINLEVEVGNLHVMIDATNTDYQVGSPLQLMCGVTEDSNVSPVGGLTYSWSSTCSGECFVTDQSNSSMIGREVLRAADSGTHTCTITDSVGNFGRANIVVMVTGVRVYHSELGLLTNNSVVRRNDEDDFGIFLCLSGSLTPNVGQWLALNGEDLLTQGLHPFQVDVGGESNTGFVSLSLLEERFDDVDQGVYSCVIPNERGEMETVHLGIHTSGASIPLVSSLVPSSVHLNSQFTLNCSTINSAATEISWSRGGVIISDDSAEYQTLQLLRAGITSSYDNLLLVTALNPNELVGSYSCLVRNSFGQQQAEVSLQGISIVASSPSEVFSLGDTMASFTCSSDLGVSSIAWFSDGQLVASSSGSVGVLTLPSVTDTMHNTQYTCRAIATFGTQEHTVNVLVEVDAERDLSIGITPSSDNPVPHEPFSITCTITKSIGLQNTPTIEWLDAMANVLTTSESDGIILSDVVTLGQMFKRTIELTSFTKVLHREFTCRGIMMSSAPPFSLTKMTTWEYLGGRDDETTTEAEPTTTPSPPDTSCNRMFQLVLGKVNDCREWTFQSAEEKQDDIITKLTAEIRQLCPSCGSAEAIDFVNLEFSCPEDEDKQFVLFRATISGSNPQHCEEILETITQYVQGGEASLLVLTNRLSINPTCDVEIETRSSILRCSPPTEPNPSAASSALGAAAGAGGVVAVVLVIVVVIVLVIIFLRLKKKKRHSSALGYNGQSGAPNTMNEAYGMCHGSAFQNPYYSNSIQGPDLPPRNDLYSIPRDVVMTTSMKKSDSYIEMDPAGTLVLGGKILDEPYAVIPPVTSGENVYERVGEEHWQPGGGTTGQVYTNVLENTTVTGKSDPPHATYCNAA